jgi:hypothetical protein
MSEPIVLPADVYDTLEFSALVFGGIGADRCWDYSASGPDADDIVPVCIRGHAVCADDAEDIGSALDRIGIYFKENDEIVRSVNRRLSREPNDRVPFDEYVREGNIVRGGA